MKAILKLPHLTTLFSVRKKTLFALAGMFFFVSCWHLSSAQTNLDFSYDLVLTSSINPVNNFDTTYAWECVIELEDTSAISNIHFEMGHAANTADMIDYAFEFDEDAFLPNGLYYRREGYTVTLGLGNYKNRTYFIEVQLEDSSDNYSEKINWNNL